jgi:hypothetical protein
MIIEIIMTDECLQKRGIPSVLFNIISSETLENVTSTGKDR